ncbi:MAG: TetR/AcrR family transcriptional regulator [Nocardioidaceae bacterium]|nr:TetR/AcrR family transcriptional regulator [Nocardioidaceae bacterium]
MTTQQSTSRREQVLEAARDLVAEGGLGAVTVRAVAARAGIGASTMRHYFPTQRDLHRAVVEGVLDAQLDGRRITDARVAPAGRLTECLAQLLPSDQAQVGALDAWFLMYAAAIGPEASLLGTQVLEQGSDVAREHVTQWCDVLADEGALAVPRRDAVDVALTVVDGLCLQLLTPGTALDVPRAHALLGLVVGSLVRSAPSVQDEAEVT